MVAAGLLPRASCVPWGVVGGSERWSACTALCWLGCPLRITDSAELCCCSGVRRGSFSQYEVCTNTCQCAFTHRGALLQKPWGTLIGSQFALLCAPVCSWLTGAASLLCAIGELMVHVVRLDFIYALPPACSVGLRGYQRLAGQCVPGYMLWGLACCVTT